MATIKKSKKAKQPLALRVFKIIIIALCCGILLAAIVKRVTHIYNNHIAK